MSVLDKDKFIGKSPKYLAIETSYYKSKIVQYTRPTNWKLTVDELCDILTPSKKSEIPRDIIPKGISDEHYFKTIDAAFTKFVTIMDILQTEYWSDLQEILVRKSKWKALELFTAAIVNGRRGYVLYRHLITAYMQLTILRTAGDHTTSAVPYED